jgi:hypothetical protein
MGSKGDLLRTLAAASGVKSATPGVRSSVLNWRRGRPPHYRPISFALDQKYNGNAGISSHICPTLSIDVRPNPCF